MKIDIITGLLGSGKTTFIKHYVRHLAAKGQNVCILVNDYGAISVDMAFLNHEIGDVADLEMVTAGDFDCYLRRTKTKLIQMAMLGYDRIIVEPSGIFDADDFYNLLYEEPLDRWYEIGNVISLVDANLPEYLSEDLEYLLIAQAATAGKVVLTKLDTMQAMEQSQNTGFEQVALEEVKETLVRHLNRESEHFHCERQFKTLDILAFDWNTATDAEMEALERAGYVRYDLEKRHVEEEGDFETMFYYTVKKSLDGVKELVQQLFLDVKYGEVMRVKGLFCDMETGNWYMLNATKELMDLRNLSDAGEGATDSTMRKEVMLVIGENLHHEEVNQAFGETRKVLDYEV